MEVVRNGRLGNRKITISDVAEALNVSESTVSRAISGKGRISEDTRQKVLAYIEENDYKPNVIAKSLAQKKTYNIALVIPSDCNLVDMPFFQNSMQGICEEASANDYDVLLVPLAGSSLANLERIIANNKVDGVILSRSVLRDKAAVFLKERDVPFVLMGTCKDTKVVQVDNDHRTGCSELIRKLLKSGIVQIGLIGGNKNYMVNRIRKQGFCDALKRAGIKLDKKFLYEDCDKPDKIEFAVRKLTEAGAECIVCMDDSICFTVLQVLAREHIAVPEQIKVVSFYDSALLMNNKPSITSLLFDDKALGTLTCKVLLKHIQGEAVSTRTMLGYKIINRESAVLEDA